MRLNHQVSTIALAFSLTATWSVSVLAISTPTNPKFKDLQTTSGFSTTTPQTYSQASPEFSFKSRCLRSSTAGVYRTFSWWERTVKGEWRFIHTGDCQCEGQHKLDCLEPGDPKDED